jgi:hypothetical protein
MGRRGPGLRDCCSRLISVRREGQPACDSTKHSAIRAPPPWPTWTWPTPMTAEAEPFGHLTDRRPGEGCCRCRWCKGRSAVRFTRRNAVWSLSGPARACSSVPPQRRSRRGHPGTQPHRRREVVTLSPRPPRRAQDRDSAMQPPADTLARCFPVSWRRQPMGRDLVKLHDAARQSRAPPVSHLRDVVRHVHDGHRSRHVTRS